MNGVAMPDANLNFPELQLIAKPVFLLDLYLDHNCSSTDGGAVGTDCGGAVGTGCLLCHHRTATRVTVSHGSVSHCDTDGPRACAMWPLRCPPVCRHPTIPTTSDAATEGGDAMGGEHKTPRPTRPRIAAAGIYLKLDRPTPHLLSSVY